MKKWNYGFSLVELIIVIAIMAVLAAVIAPALIRYIAKSRRASDVQTASVIMSAVTYAYSEGYSFEGDVSGVAQDADVVGTDILNNISVGSETPYSLEVISIAKNEDTFVNNTPEQQHFLDLVRQTIGKNNNIGKDFSTPKCKQNSGNGVPAGFLIGRKLDNGGSPLRFEVWLCDSGNTPIYRLTPDCCSQYK